MPKTICIVDDQPSLRQTLRFALSQQGYHILEAENGMDATKLLAKEPVDVLILDWQMPVMNGMDLVRLLRGQPEYDLLPIIMVSSWDDISVRKEAYSLGVNSWLKKPFRMAEIQNVVENALLTIPTHRTSETKDIASGSL